MEIERNALLMALMFVTVLSMGLAFVRRSLFLVRGKVLVRALMCCFMGPRALSPGASG